MRNNAKTYYLRTAAVIGKREPKWSEWYGPVIAYGPYTAALHFARQQSIEERHRRIRVQVNNDGELLEIEFVIRKSFYLTIVESQDQKQKRS